MPQNPLKLFKLANLKPAYSASPISSHQNHDKDSCPQFAHLPQAGARPQFFSMRQCPLWHCGIVDPLLLGTMSKKHTQKNKIIFQW